MPRLTDTLIRAAEPPEKGQRTIIDDTLPNFGLRVSQGGAKTFVVTLGRGRRHTIGHYPLVSLADARKVARRILAERELGHVRPRVPALEEARAAFLADCGTRNRPRTVRDYTRLLKYLDCPMDVRPHELVLILDRLAHVPSERHHAYVAFRIFFTWCVRKHLIEHSPMEHIAVPQKKPPRERLLTEDELGTVYQTARSSTDTFHHIVSLLVLTGLRRGTVARLEWSWFENGLLSIPPEALKNNRPLLLPYGEEVQTVLHTIPHIEGSPFLFPAARKSTDATTCFNGWGKPKARFDRECGVYDWTLHTLRKNFATAMQQLGVRLEVTEALLGHVSGTQAGIVSVYQKYHWLPEKRAAILQYEAFLGTLIAPKG